MEKRFHISDILSVITINPIASKGGNIGYGFFNVIEHMTRTAYIKARHADYNELLPTFPTKRITQITPVPDKVRLFCAKKLLGALPQIDQDDLDEEFSPYGPFFMGMKMMEGNSFSTVDDAEERYSAFREHIETHGKMWERKWGAWHCVEQLDSDTVISLNME